VPSPDCRRAPPLADPGGDKFGSGRLLEAAGPNPKWWANKEKENMNHSAVLTGAGVRGGGAACSVAGQIHSSFRRRLQPAGTIDHLRLHRPTAHRPCVFVSIPKTT
jgi:hypothetical protein